MPDFDLPSAGGRDGVGGPESSGFVASIANDFAALIAIFDRQLELLSASDNETRSHLRRAKRAAERGAKLSQQLLELTQSSR